ncbi:hypothetical protein EV421DRAFT_1743902 [Armillaria borealis]|uniref:Uncharacterized protein n=1 Tax=Armillaria borealis TaxID=47425 RepID=A0AA39IU90_9AGAR|nr:hypothetical protein EV421DRAFT_1743902 [Armillaria borealis]
MDLFDLAVLLLDISVKRVGDEYNGAQEDGGSHGSTVMVIANPAGRGPPPDLAVVILICHLDHPVKGDAKDPDLSNGGYNPESTLLRPIEGPTIEVCLQSWLGLGSHRDGPWLTYIFIKSEEVRGEAISGPAYSLALKSSQFGHVLSQETLRQESHGVADPVISRKENKSIMVQIHTTGIAQLGFFSAEDLTGQPRVMYAYDTEGSFNGQATRQIIVILQSPIGPVFRLPLRFVERRAPIEGVDCWIMLLLSPYTVVDIRLRDFHKRGFEYDVTSAFRDSVLTSGFCLRH